MGSRRRESRVRNLTGRYLSNKLDERQVEPRERFSARTEGAGRRKMRDTALLRAAEELVSGDLEALPIGRVTQVYSLYYDVVSAGVTHLCVMRKTLAKLSDTAFVTCDLVRFRPTGDVDDTGRPTAVIEQMLPRRTLLTRADSFKAIDAQPIVANADQVLIVASVLEPRIKWGLIDRMIVAATAGSLTPILCLNKIDLGDADEKAAAAVEHARANALYYESIGVKRIETSVPAKIGLDALAAMLKDKVTVLAGHSGVGKSSLINAVEPALDIRVGRVSTYTEKGRHTTTSTREYPLAAGGTVVDSPGVKLFGLWGLTRENLVDCFPDVAAGTAPDWRQESFDRIVASMPQERADRD